MEKMQASKIYAILICTIYVVAVLRFCPECIIFFSVLAFFAFLVGSFAKGYREKIQILKLEMLKGKLSAEQEQDKYFKESGLTVFTSGIGAGFVQSYRGLCSLGKFIVKTWNKIDNWFIYYIISIGYRHCRRMFDCGLFGGIVYFIIQILLPWNWAILGFFLLLRTPAMIRWSIARFKNIWNDSWDCYNEQVLVDIEQGTCHDPWNNIYYR